MTGTNRLLVCLGVLAGSVAALLLLEFHLRSVPVALPRLLRQPLDRFPKELRSSALAGRFTWVADDSPSPLVTPLYHADEWVGRSYARAGAAGECLLVYLIYSRTGEDRKHHPEYCLRDARRIPEDDKGRLQVALDHEQRRVVQRYRFRTPTPQPTTVYYWHYTLDQQTWRRPGQTWLQAMHQRLKQSSASLTVQVSLTARPEAVARVEQSFLQAMDDALTEHFLPSGARLGCARTPIHYRRID